MALNGVSSKQLAELIAKLPIDLARMTQAALGSQSPSGGGQRADGYAASAEGLRKVVGDTGRGRVVRGALDATAMRRVSAAVAGRVDPTVVGALLVHLVELGKEGLAAQIGGHITKNAHDLSVVRNSQGQFEDKV